MKAIKVFFSIVIVLAILVLLVAPPIVGLWIKANAKDIIAQNKNQNITTKISHYDFGWFTSKVTIEMDIHLQQPKTTNKSATSNTKNENVRFNAIVNIHHGPVIYLKRQNNPSLYFAWGIAKITIPTLNLTGHSVWSFNNTITSRFSSPSFKIAQGDSTMALKKLKGKLAYNLDSHHLKLDLTVASFTASNLIQFDNLTYATNVDRERRINYGIQRLDVDKITLTTPDGSTIHFNKLSANSNTALNNGAIGMTAKYTIQSISKNVLGITGVQLDFSIKNVDAKSLNTLLANLQDQPKNKQTIDYKNLVTPGMDLLRHGLTVQINSAILNTNDGTVSLNGTLTIPTLSKNTTFLQIPASMKADFQFQAPKSWLQQQMALFIGFFQQSQQQNQAQRQNPSEVATSTLQQWENQKLLISSGNDYKAHIQFMDGQLLINGKAPIMKKTQQNNTNNPQSPQDQVTPSTPDQLTPSDTTTPLITRDQITPHQPGPLLDQTKPSTPDQVTPATPDTTTPSTPDQVTPSTPDTTTPSTPDQVTPSTPDTTTPSTPDQVTPSPSTPGEVPISPNDPMLKKIPPTEPVDQCMPRQGDRL